MIIKVSIIILIVIALIILLTFYTIKRKRDNEMINQLKKEFKEIKKKRK